VQWFGTHL